MFLTYVLLVYWMLNEMQGWTYDKCANSILFDGRIKYIYIILKGDPNTYNIVYKNTQI